MGVDPAVEDALARLARLARAQNGALGWDQLRLHLTPDAIRARVARGALFHVFYKAYTVADPALLTYGREAAALLSLGPTAVLSHGTAAALWRIAEPGTSEIDVTLPGRQARPRPGIRLHRVPGLDPADIRIHSGLRLTSPARTLIDMAAHVRPWELESAFGEARAKRLIHDGALIASLTRLPRNHTGASIVRRLLRSEPGSTYTRSKAERRVRRLMTEAELPQPLVNARRHGFTLDFLWPEERLVLEVDGVGTHGDRLAFERDRRRDQVLAAFGYTVIRVTWDQLCAEPLAVVVRIAQALARRAA
ncbi:MAG TPA: DUF559 domain-containing protein [Solirubrobacteraceae bacterium]|nr:DUF559 domain-containing protein [Solirubrobacteraceae bacterium]